MTSLVPIQMSKMNPIPRMPYPVRRKVAESNWELDVISRQRMKMEMRIWRKVMDGRLIARHLH